MSQIEPNTLNNFDNIPAIDDDEQSKFLCKRKT